MFTKEFDIEGQDVTLSFRDFISEDATIYMVTGWQEPLFMGFSSEEGEWLFLNTVPDALLDIEEELSEFIMEQEAAEDEEDVPYLRKAG